MDRGIVLLQGLRAKLEGSWLDSIRRATGATSITFEPLSTGEFVLVVSWKNGEQEHSFKKEFTKALVLGSSLRRPMAEWHVEKRACDHAKDIMREVLAQRGVL